MSSGRTRLVWLYPKIEKPMGGTNFVLFAARELMRRYDVVIVAQRTSPMLAAECRRLGLELVSLHRPTFTELAFWLFYPVEIRRNARRIAALLREGDVVLSSYYPMHVAAHRIGRNDVQIVYEPFALFRDAKYLRQQGMARRIFLRTAEKFFGAEEIEATRAARRLLTLSAFERSRLKSIYGVDAAVVGEGVDLEVYHPSGDTLADDPGATVVLHSTGFDRYKGTDTVIAAVPALAARIPNLKLLITYTREEPAALARYRKSLTAAGVSRCVSFLGSLPYDALPKLYRTARIYVEPGEDRSASLSVKEAMACGTPVVRGAEGYDEIDDGVEGFLVKSGDVEGFVDRVTRICTDDDLRAKLSQAAARRARERYSWSAVADRIAEHIEAVLDRGRFNRT